MKTLKIWHDSRKLTHKNHKYSAYCPGKITVLRGKTGSGTCVRWLSQRRASRGCGSTCKRSALEARSKVLDPKTEVVRSVVQIISKPAFNKQLLFCVCVTLQSRCTVAVWRNMGALLLTLHSVANRTAAPAKIMRVLPKGPLCWYHDLDVYVVCSSDWISWPPRLVFGQSAIYRYVCVETEYRLVTAATMDHVQ